MFCNRVTSKSRLLASACLVLMFACLSQLSYGQPSSSKFYVSLDGLDTSEGTKAKPFATLEKAREAIRSLKSGGGLPEGGVTVYLRGGVYSRTSTFNLTEQDSGEADKPVVYQAYPGEKVHIVGGRELYSSWFSLVVESSGVWGQLDDAAKGKLLQVDLGAHGIKDYGRLNQGSGMGGSDPPLELIFNDDMMRLARWPNRDFELTASAPSNHEFGYSGTRPERWTAAPDMWVFGYWHWNFMDDYMEVASINTATKVIAMPTDPLAGYGIIAGQRWYAFNLIEEIDIPGEWYLDRGSGILYFWPPADLKKGTTLISTLKSKVIEIKQASYITLRGMILEVGRAGGISVSGGNNNLVAECIIRHFGQHGVDITGTDNGVEDCEIYNIECGVVLSGGNRSALTPANLFVHNSHIYNFGRWSRTYVPAVSILGCGNKISHNLIHDGPHSAITHYGNDHLVEYNIIHNVVTETTDSGAIYSGRHWDFQGNVFSYNFFHNIRNDVHSDTHAIYLDDMLSGHMVFGNVFYDIGGCGTFNNGGPDNVYENNLFAKCDRAHYATRRGVGHINCKQGDVYYERFLGALLKFDYQNPPWSTAYPKAAAIPNECTSPEFEKYKNPFGTRFIRNLGWKNNRFLYEGAGGIGALNYYETKDNIENQDPLFYDESKLILALRESSPAYDIAGFERIPFEKIGRLRRDKACRPIPPDGHVDADEDYFYWAPALHAKSRDVYLGTDSGSVAKADPTCGEFKGNISEPKYAPVKLKPFTNYYWRIDEKGPGGQILSKGDVWTFMTGSTIAKHPRPTHGAEFVHPQAVTLKWKKGVGTVSHDVYLGTAGMPAAEQFRGNQAEATYQADTLEPETTYYWRVDENNNAGVKTRGRAWSFTTASKAARQLKPANGQKDILFLMARLEWEAGIYAVSHDVYLGTSRRLTARQFKGNQASATYRPSLLEPDTPYYWRIDQVDDSGNKTIGQVWSFRTSPKAKLISWWRQGLVNSPTGNEQLDTNSIAEGSKWIRQADSANGYGSKRIHGDVTATKYDGPKHAGAVLEASRWASRFNSGAVALSSAKSAKTAHNFTGPFSVFFRLRLLTETAEGMLAANQMKWNIEGNTEISVLAKGRIFMRLNDAANDFCHALIKPDVPVGTWFDLVCIYNGDSREPINFYVNGREEPLAKLLCSHIGALRTHNNSWVIGARRDGRLDLLKETEIESVAFFKGVLTESEIRALSFP